MFSSSQRFSGLVAAMATPVTASGAVDFVMVDRLCDFLVSRGVTGVCLGGATAEYPRFETAERLDILRRVARRLPPETTMLVAIGGASRQRTLDLGRAAFDHGCRAVLLPMPVFFRYQQGDLAAYAVDLAASLDGPALLYDLPQFTTGLDTTTTIGLLESHPRIVGLKDSSGRLERLQQLAAARGPRTWTLLAGDDRYGLAALQTGWDGAISGLAACCPELLLALHDAFRRGEVERARCCQTWVDELIVQLARLPTPWGVKVVLAARGLDTGPMALPPSVTRQAEMASIAAWFPAWFERTGLAAPTSRRDSVA